MKLWVYFAYAQWCIKMDPFLQSACPFPWQLRFSIFSLAIVFFLIFLVRGVKWLHFNIKNIGDGIFFKLKVIFFEVDHCHENLKKQSKGKIGAKRQNLAIVWLKIYESEEKTYIRVETKYRFKYRIQNYV